MDVSVAPDGTGLAIATTRALYFTDPKLHTRQSIPGCWTAVAWLDPDWCLATKDRGDATAWDCSLELVRRRDAMTTQSIELGNYPLHVAAAPGGKRVLVTLQDRVHVFRVE